jgi:hypothetical protein
MAPPHDPWDGARDDNESSREERIGRILAECSDLLNAGSTIEIERVE